LPEHCAKTFLMLLAAGSSLPEVTSSPNETPATVPSKPKDEQPQLAAPLIHARNQVEPFRQGELRFGSWLTPPS
jgi:hypothetical protein